MVLELQESPTFLPFQSLSLGLISSQDRLYQGCSDTESRQITMKGLLRVLWWVDPQSWKVP